MATSNPRQDLREIYVGHVISPTTFYVSEPRAVWASEAVMSIINLEAELSRMALRPLSKCLIPGELCSFKLDDHSCWRRGKVLNVFNGGNEANILMIDYGNVYQNVHVSNCVRELPEKYSAYDQLAFQLHIPGITPPNQYGMNEWPGWVSRMVSQFEEDAEATFVSDMVFDTPTSASGELFLQLSPNRHIEPRVGLQRYRHLLGDRHLVGVGEVLASAFAKHDKRMKASSPQKR